MNRQQIIEKMAAHLDREVRLTPHEDDWEPERIAEELLDIVAEAELPLVPGEPSIFDHDE